MIEVSLIGRVEINYVQPYRNLFASLYVLLHLHTIAKYKYIQHHIHTVTNIEQTNKIYNLTAIHTTRAYITNIIKYLSNISTNHTTYNHQFITTMHTTQLIPT